MRLGLAALKRRLPFIIFLLVLLIAALAVYIDWTWKRKLSPRGGRYFFHRVRLLKFSLQAQPVGAARREGDQIGAALFADENKDPGGQRHDIEEENG